MNKSELDRYRSQGASALVDAYERQQDEIERLRSACQLGIDMFVANDINVPNTIETLQDAINESPQTSLAERDAEVAKKAFVDGVEWCNECHFNGSFSCEVYAANQYANQLRAAAKDGE